MKKIKWIIACVLAAIMISAVAIGCTPKTDEEELSITFAEKSITIGVGDTQTISVTVTGSSDQVTFTSAKPDTATVTAKTATTAEVTGVKSGSTKITAQIGNKVAELTVKVEVSTLRAESWAVSAAPGESDSFKVTMSNTSAFPEVSSPSDSVTVSVKDVQDGVAEIGFTVSASANPGDAVEITVYAGEKSVKVWVDVCSKDIIYGDGTINGLPFISDENGLLVRGVGNQFQSGALAIPNCARFNGAWAPISHIGSSDELFEVPAGLEITSLDTGDSATTIQHGVFKGFHTISNVYIGSSIQGIGNEAFDMRDYCTMTDGTLSFDGTIETITFAEDCVLNTIGSYSFAGNKLTYLILPDSIVIMAYGAFWHAGSMVIKLPASWANANDYPEYTVQFFDNTNLRELYIPWQCFFSVTTDRYPNDEDEATEKGLICSCFSLLTIVNNYASTTWTGLKVYYSGTQEQFDGMMNLCNSFPLAYEWIWQYVFTVPEIICNVSYGDI